MPDIQGAPDPKLCDPVVFPGPVLVIDTETTGFVTDPWAEVVELAGVVLAEDGSEGDTFSSLVRPEVVDTRAEPALAVNRLSPAELRRAPARAEVTAAFLAWWRLHGRPWVTSYNVAFDRGMMARMFGLDDPAAGPLRWARCIQARATVHLGRAGKLPLLDPSDARRAAHAALLAASLGQPVPWRPARLVDAAEALGVPFVGPAHRALSDARTAGRVAVELVRRGA